MARSLGVLPSGTRITDYISLGVLNQRIPLARIKAMLREGRRSSKRVRELPAHVVVYYVIALALYMQSPYKEVLRCLLESLRWLTNPLALPKVTGKSGISQARTRLGWEVMRAIHDDVVRPIAVPKTRGAWYRGRRVVSLDGSTLDVADTPGNAQAFGRPSASRGRSAFPQVRFVSLVENGTHALCGTRAGGFHDGEVSLAKGVVNALDNSMLCLADRLFFSYGLWNLARGKGTQLLWRVKKNLRLRCVNRLPDGSYLSVIYPPEKDRRKQTNGVKARVIEYKLRGTASTEPFYRLVTTILDDTEAPAKELASLYSDRWEIETALDELKTHLRGARIVLRSRTPDLVRQEFYGLVLAHYAVRGLMHEAALREDVDPDRLSFTHAVAVVRRRIPQYAAFPPSAKGTAT